MTSKTLKGGTKARDLNEQQRYDQCCSTRLAGEADRTIRGDREEFSEAKLEQDLKNAGVQVQSFREVSLKPRNFKAAIPILLNHMQMGEYPEPTKNNMAQIIAMKEANPYWETMVKLFYKALSEGEEIFADGLAVALSKSYREPQLGELISMCGDKRLGLVRILLANGLRRSKDIRAEVALLRLVDDPEIGEEVARWLKKRSASGKSKQ